MAALLALLAALWLPSAVALRQLHRPWGHGEGVQHGHLPGRLAHASKHEMYVQLCGEPKSGTTWLELIVYFAIERLCLDGAYPSRVWGDKQATDGSCAADMPTLENSESEVRAYEYTSIFEGAPISFVASAQGKHNVPFAQDTGNLACVGVDMDTPPCSLEPGGIAGRLLPAVAACADRCWASRAPVRSMRVLHVHRDPRDVAVSLCFWLNSDFKHSKNLTVALQECVRGRYASIALWVKFRELWFQRLEELRVARVYHVGYEEMLAQPEEAFRVITSALSMAATPAQIEDLVNITAASNLRGDTTVDPHDGDNGSRKIRSAGKKTYRDYHLPLQLVGEMDNIYRELNFTTFRFART